MFLLLCINTTCFTFSCIHGIDCLGEELTSISQHPFNQWNPHREKKKKRESDLRGMWINTGLIESLILLFLGNLCERVASSRRCCFGLGFVVGSHLDLSHWLLAPTAFCFTFLLFPKKLQRRQICQQDLRACGLRILNATCYAFYLFRLSLLDVSLLMRNWEIHTTKSTSFGHVSSIVLPTKTSQRRSDWAGGMGGRFCERLLCVFFT